MLEEEKKTYRKQKRFAARLKSSKGIICIEKPNRNVVLCNVGKATGLIKEDVHDLIIKTLPNLVLPKLIAEKGETHSFLVFNSDDDAALFYKECNGKIKLRGTLVYMNFVENAPNLEVICEHDLPTGLLILNDFITPAEEDLFLKLFKFEESSNLKNRQVAHYGYDFRYGSNDVDLSAPLIQTIPKECDLLWQRLREQGIDVGVPDQLTVNKYEPGQGIPSHVDKHSPFGDTILSVSLGSSVVMDWKHHSGKYVPVVVPARSLLIMQGEARYDWQHGIQPRTWDPVIRTEPACVVTADSRPRRVRVSLTFRWTRSGVCACSYPTLCDSRSGTEIDAVASRLEEIHVHQVYEQIAGHFSTTRHKPWPKVVEFMLGVPQGSVVLDLGSGNGKNILLRDDILQIAGERSSGLLSECHQRLSNTTKPNDCVRLDLCSAPLRDACADAAICIAVVHHFSSKPRRLAAVSSIQRVLRRGGRALVTVWAKDQTRSNYLDSSKQPSDDAVVSVEGVTLPVHQNRTQFKHQDLLVPWKLRNVKDNKLSDAQNTLLRYYHVFEENELDGLCEEVGFIVEKSFYEEGNWCVVCRKK
ncbi:alkylated DNA repair protein alkB homolog 8 isoform X1 [Cydia pomonella]|uniref:alkylated DNA repair protein alkB homolog 8 isoform X1 n=2 Tax=Cydia pomonella TaxID=82600 RepID=UPI002ADE16BF|nr:alkylated DNA repair protein alkB homolog 8 isoform X1 [Cydia pomonella]